MIEEHYPSNSHKSKEKREPKEQKEIKPVAKAVKTRKKSTSKRMIDMIFNEDINSIKSYILLDVVLPAFKKTVVDVVTEGINSLVYGEDRPVKTVGTASKISYQNYYDRKNRIASSDRGRATSTILDYEDIVFESRGEAESVLSRMQEVISVYGTVSVSDLYELADISTDNYQLNKFGWSNLRNAEVVRIRDGYVIKLPKPFPLD